MKCVGPHWWWVDFLLKSTGKVTLVVVDVLDKPGQPELKPLDVDVIVDDGPFGQNKVEVDILDADG